MTQTSHLALPVGREELESIRDWVPMQDDHYYRFPLPLKVRTSVERFKSQLQRNLEERLRNVFEDEFYKICAFVSPRTKEMTFLTQLQNQSLKRSLIRMIRNNKQAQGESFGTNNTSSQQQVQRRLNDVPTQVKGFHTYSQQFMVTKK